MTTSRKHPSAAFWTTVAVVVALVAYPLSCPLALMIYMRHPTPRLLDAVNVYHAPLLQVLNKSSGAIQDAWIAYRDWCLSSGE